MMTDQQSGCPKEKDAEKDSECLRASKMMIRGKKVHIARKVMKEVESSLKGSVQVTKRQLQKWKLESSMKQTAELDAIIFEELSKQMMRIPQKERKRSNTISK